MLQSVSYPTSYFTLSYFLKSDGAIPHCPYKRSSTPTKAYAYANKTAKSIPTKACTKFGMTVSVAQFSSRKRSLSVNKARPHSVTSNRPPIIKLLVNRKQSIPASRNRSYANLTSYIQYTPINIWSLIKQNPIPLCSYINKPIRNACYIKRSLLRISCKRLKNEALMIKKKKNINSFNFQAHGIL